MIGDYEDRGLLKKIVGEGLLKKAGFYPAPSFIARGYSNGEILWYLGGFNEESIVILKNHKTEEGITEWYFNSFRCEPSIRELCCDKSRLSEFFKKIEEIYTKEYRIAAIDLKEAILDALAA